MVTQLRGMGRYFSPLAQGSSHSIAFSVDGITWNGRGGNVITVCKGVVWAGNLWVVVGEGINNIYGSTYTNNWYKIGETYEDKRTVNGVEVITYPLRLYQYDPNSNNNAVTVLFNGCNGVAWNGTRVVAVGDGNTNIGSGSPATGNYNTIAYVDGFHRLAGRSDHGISNLGQVHLMETTYLIGVLEFRGTVRDGSRLVKSLIIM